MELQEAMLLLEQAQTLIEPVLENAQDLISNENFKNSMKTAMTLLNICAQDLADKDCLEDLFSDSKR